MTFIQRRCLAMTASTSVSVANRPLPRGIETTIDAFEFLRGCLICATLEAGINFERDLGELLGLFGPSLDPPHCLFECF